MRRCRAGDAFQFCHARRRAGRLSFGRSCRAGSAAHVSLFPGYPSPVLESARPASPLRLLLVEDNEDTRFLLSVLLEERYDLTVAASGAAAMAALEDGVFDLVVLDINLGAGANGLDVLEAIRASSVHANVPVIALTAYAMPGDRERFLEKGFTDYVAKPFSAEDLFAVLASRSRSLAA